MLNGLEELLRKFADQKPAVPSQKNRKPDTLLDAPQKTVQRAQRNSRNWLQSLTQLVTFATEGKIFVDEHASAPAPEKAGRTPPNAEPKHQPKNIEIWADKVKASTAAKPRNATVATQKQQPVYRLWTFPDTRETVAAVNHVKKDLENGKKPVATLAANYEPASELKTLVQAHGFTDIKTAVVLTSRESPETLDKKRAHVNIKSHGPEIKKFPMFHLGSELPAFLTCQASPAALPTTAPEAMTLRVTIRFCFCSHNLRSCKASLRTLCQESCLTMILRKVSSPPYGWRTLQSQQRTSYAEAVTGFLKLGKNSLEDVLKISAKHGSSLNAWPRTNQEMPLNGFPKRKMKMTWPTSHL